MTPLSLAGRHVIITGASSGIGAAAARIAASLGASVSLIARRADRLEALAAEIGAAAGAFPGDAGDKAALLGAIDAAEARFGPAHGLIANAGVSGPIAPVADYPDEEVEALFRIHYWSLFWAMKRVLPGMIERGVGSIIATGSVGSARGLPGTCGYNAAKHAMLGLVRTAAGEVARHGVRVNCVLPGVTETELLAGLATTMAGGNREAGLDQMSAIAPIGRLATPDEVAWSIVFLLTDAAAYVTGQGWAIDGGFLDSVAAPH